MSDPNEETRELLSDLKKALDLPTTASTSEVFRAALALAKKAAKEAREYDG